MSILVFECFSEYITGKTLINDLYLRTSEVLLKLIKKYNLEYKVCKIIVQVCRCTWYMEGVTGKGDRDEIATQVMVDYYNEMNLEQVYAFDREYDIQRQLVCMIDDKLLPISFYRNKILETSSDNLRVYQDDKLLPFSFYRNKIFVTSSDNLRVYQDNYIKCRNAKECWDHVSDMQVDLFKVLKKYIMSEESHLNFTIECENKENSRIKEDIKMKIDKARESLRRSRERVKNTYIRNLKLARELQHKFSLCFEEVDFFSSLIKLIQTEYSLYKRPY